MFPQANEHIVAQEGAGKRERHLLDGACRGLEDEEEEQEGEEEVEPAHQDQSFDSPPPCAALMAFLSNEQRLM